MKYLCFLFCLSILSCGHPKRHYTLSELKHRRDWIEKYSLKHKSEMVVFAKVPGKAQLIKIVNDKWPDETEYAYNVLKDSSGNVILIYSSPVSESGDWNVEHNHYFDPEGNTFLFERHANAFNDCSAGDEVAYETVKKYFDSDFNIMEKTDNLVDKKGKHLNKSECSIDFAIQDATIYPNAESCMRAYNIIF